VTEEKTRRGSWNRCRDLKIQYEIDGKPGEATLPENATVLLPMPR
jgi:hypothetical protein